MIIFRGHELHELRVAGVANVEAEEGSRQDSPEGYRRRRAAGPDCGRYSAGDRTEIPDHGLMVILLQRSFRFGRDYKMFIRTTPCRN